MSNLASNAFTFYNNMILETRASLLSDVSNFGFVSLVHKNNRFGGGFIRNIACDSKKCNVINTENDIGFIRPALEIYAKYAIEALKCGKIIAVPTDTLYGFACDACSLEAVNRIYKIKGRKHTSPLAVCVGEVEDINRVAITDYLPYGLLHSLLPGPVTVVLKRGDSSILEKSLNPGFNSIGVRVPDNNFIRVIANGGALALTSANLSGYPSSVCINDFQNLWEHCACVFDGSILPAGRAGSTIVDLTQQGNYKIIRPGSAREETIAILERHLLVMMEEDTKP